MVVVGRDVSGGQYARRAETLGCAGRVVWAGYREDPEPFYAAADVFLMPSYWEGCPTALLEAMAWRLPVVASRISAIAQIARSGREAILAPPRDAAALAEALARVLRDPPRAAALADAARNRVLDRYTLDRMVARHENLYRRLTAVTAGRPRSQSPVDVPIAATDAPAAKD
jgi:glycosyltransferase involved in cell wall biosynthesis